MIKISNIFLLILLSITSSSIQAMDHNNLNAWDLISQRPLLYTAREKTPIDIATAELIEAINNEDFKFIENIIKNIKDSNLDLNKLDSSYLPLPVLYYIFVNFYDQPSDFKLKVIEYLIRNDIDLNNTYFVSYIDKRTPLEDIIHDINSTISLPYGFAEDKLPFYYKLINLLLAYGEKITDKAIALAKESKYAKQIVKIFIQHLKLITQAKKNPTGELLYQAISDNKPYIAKLIILHKPEFITSEIIELAKARNSYLAPNLKRILAIQKFRQSELGQCLPHELAKYIEQFVELKNKGTFA